MLPTHGEAPLAYPRTLAAAWWLFAFGAAAYVGALWTGIERYWIPALAAACGLSLELLVLVATHARARRRDATWAHFAAALGWLGALALAGTLMAYDRQRGLVFRDPEGGLIAHVHMALIGFVATAIYGAGRRLIPWVAMDQSRSRWEGRASFVLTQAGLAGLALDALFFGRRLMPLWACLIAAGFLLYALQLRPLLSRGPAFNPSLAFTVLSFAGGALWAALGLGLAFGAFADVAPARGAYVWTALIGCVTPMILAQVHKIAPFLVWLHVYSPTQGTPPAPVPTIDDLTSRGLAWAEVAALAVAAPLGAAGLGLERGGLVRGAGGFLLVCAACYAWNLGSAIRHVAPSVKILPWLWRLLWPWRARLRPGVEVGDRFPDFRLRDTRGNEHALYAGAPGAWTVLWLTNLCEDCRAKIPLLEEVQRESNGRVRVLAVSILSVDDPLPGRIAGECGFPILLDPEDIVALRLGQAHPPGACPLRNLYIVDESGTIRFTHHLSAIRPEEFRASWKALSPASRLSGGVEPGRAKR